MKRCTLRAQPATGEEATGVGNAERNKKGGQGVGVGVGGRVAWIGSAVIPLTLLVGPVLW